MGPDAGRIKEEQEIAEETEKGHEDRMTGFTG
jgi:hypothetical protein